MDLVEGLRPPDVKTCGTWGPKSFFGILRVKGIRRAPRYGYGCHDGEDEQNAQEDTMPGPSVEELSHVGHLLSLNVEKFEEYQCSR